MRRRVVTCALVFGAWTALGLLIASQAAYRVLLAGGELSWSRVAQALIGVYSWAAFTPIIVAVSRRRPLGAGLWRRHLPAHVLTVLVLMPVDVGLFLAADQFWLHTIEWATAEGSFAERFWRLYLWSLPYSLLWYAAVVGIWHAIDSQRLLRERELRKAELESRLNQARLQLLRMQLQPHFLFNTLHAISALVNEDPPAARRMIARLAQLLRLTLETDGKQEVSLRQELDLLDPYLAIQQTRFQDRLAVRRLVEPEALGARVPSMILQPLVENAVRHGIAPRSNPGRVEIHARRRDGTLELEVRDDGGGSSSGAAPFREGLGLANTRARLRQLYGDQHRFELRNLPGGGVAVAMTIPFRRRAAGNGGPRT